MTPSRSDAEVRLKRSRYVRLSIDDVFELFHLHGGHSYGEDVTQLDHALQTAALAQADGADEALVAAALLHDIGQFLEEAGEAAEREGRDARHEANGAALLAGTFPPEVTEPIRLHVEAKRYLCAVEPGYLQGLSAASRLSLAYQGGPMSQDEQRGFQREPGWRAALRLRRYDDGGKAARQALLTLESYRALLERARRSAP